MYRVEFSSEARFELSEIASYVKEISGDTGTSERLISSILDAAESLSTFPRRRSIAARDERTGVELRCLRIGSYQLVYTVNGSRVLIIAVLHGRSDIEARLASALRLQ